MAPANARRPKPQDTDTVTAVPTKPKRIVVRKTGNVGQSTTLSNRVSDGAKSLPKASSQAAAKVAQGYIDRPVPSTCANCKNFRSEMIIPKWARSYKNPDIYKREGNVRCGMGDFAVKKSATCDKFKRKESKK